MSTEILLKSLDLATIVTWVMIIGVAVLLFVSRTSSSSGRSRRSSKR